MSVRSRKLITEVQKMAKDRRTGLYVPRHINDARSSWPVCQTCHRDVEAIELKNRNSKGVELWARCHGAEDWYTIKFPYELPNGSGQDVVDDHVKAALKSFLPFQPSIA